jgi:hypothetical protein
MKRKLEKHLSYFTVLEAFQRAKGCAMCELEARDMHRDLDNLLHENVNDVGVRGNLARSRGYCRRHAHVLLEFADGLGTAILYQAQVRLFLEFLKGQTGLPAKLCRKNLPESWNLEAVCPACVMQTQGRQMYIGTMLEWLGDPQLRKAFDDSPGLCVPHLLLVLRQVRDAAERDRLIKVHVSKFAALAQELAEFIRKQDYRFRDEPSGTEKDSWQRAVNMMVGVKNVF